LPDEDITKKLSPWLNWIELLSLTASSMTIPWGILTNGMELRIYDFSLDKFAEKFYWANIEKIIGHSNDESFYSLYKILFFLRHQTDYAHGVETKKKPEVKKSTKPVKGQRQYYNTQVGKPENPVPKSDPHISLLLAIDLYYEMTKKGKTFDQACDIVAKKYGILSATVRQNLFTRLHVNSGQFSALIKNKKEFIFHLNFCFPKESDNINYLLE
jgi:hypothetical protein